VAWCTLGRVVTLGCFHITRNGVLLTTWQSTASNLSGIGNCTGSLCLIVAELGRSSWEETGLRLTVFIAIAEEARDWWLVDALLLVKDKLNRGWSRITVAGDVDQGEHLGVELQAGRGRCS